MSNKINHIHLGMGNFNRVLVTMFTAKSIFLNQQ